MRISEQHIGAAVEKWLGAHGWTVYPEVAVWNHGRGGFADIVATRPSGDNFDLWAIECKTAFGFGVLEQAVRHLQSADFVSIATPYAGTSQARVLALSGLRIGHITTHERYAVFSDGIERDWMLEVREPCPAPRLNNRAADGPREKLLARLCSAHIERGITPGAQFARRVTAFTLTCDRIRAYVEANPGCGTKELVRNIEHHYGTAKAAESSIRKWAIARAIPGVAVAVVHGRTTYVPAESDGGPDLGETVDKDGQAAV